MRTVRFGYGVYFGGSNAASRDAVIRGNVIFGAADYGIRIDSRGTGGRTGNVIISGNNILQAAPIGLFIAEAQGIAIEDSVLRDSGPLGDTAAPGCEGRALTFLHRCGV